MTDKTGRSARFGDPGTMGCYGCGHWHLPGPCKERATFDPTRRCPCLAK
jgi:hypothetical protein